MNRQIKVKVVDWHDPRFLAAFEAGLTAAFHEGFEVGEAGLAERVEADLHRQGFPFAWIDDRRSVDDALAGTARWTVWRDRSVARHVS